MYGVHIRKHSPAQKVEECRVFPDEHTVTTISKIKVTSRAALKAAQAMESAPAGVAGVPNIPSDPASTIQKLQVLLAPTL